MRALYHWRLDPFSRQARIALEEKRLRVRLVEERVWDGRQAFLALNPAGSTPVLVLEPGAAGRTVIVGARALLEWLEETVHEPPLLPKTPAARAEARRIADWFDRKFDAEVNATVLFERLEKTNLGLGTPDLGIIREGLAALRQHLRYVGQLADARGWLAGDALSIADIAAAAHLSCVDYLGEAPWEEFPQAKTWYQMMKSRPSMRSVLEDQLPGFPPARLYAELDF